MALPSRLPSAFRPSWKDPFGGLVRITCSLPLSRPTGARPSVRRRAKDEGDPKRTESETISPPGITTVREARERRRHGAGPGCFVPRSSRNIFSHRSQSGCMSPGHEFAGSRIRSSGLRGPSISHYRGFISFCHVAPNRSLNFPGTRPFLYNFET